MDIEQFITDRVDDQIKWHDKKSQIAQKYYKAYQVIEITLAAIIPLLSFFADKFIIQFTIAVIGSSIAIIEAITKLYKFHENWISYRCTCEALKTQKYLYVTKSAPYNVTQETVDTLFVKNIEMILSSQNNQWSNLHNQQQINI
ncbi:DUF4231 domain-containing protein [Lachnospiraceae bacterium 46-61]